MHVLPPNGFIKNYNSDLEILFFTLQLQLREYGPVFAELTEQMFIIITIILLSPGFLNWTL